MYMYVYIYEYVYAFPSIVAFTPTFMSSGHRSERDQSEHYHSVCKIC